MAKKLLTLEDLTEKQARFVELYVETGGAKGHLARIVHQAGYECASDDSAYSIASHNLRNPKVLEVIEGLARAKFKAGAIAATEFLMNMLNNEVDGQAVPIAERRKAATELLDRGGLMAINRSEVDVTVSDERTERELLASVKARMEALGITPPAALLNGPDKTVDAEFEEVDPAAPYGRKVDDTRPGVGLPRKKPGPKKWKRRLITKEGAIPEYYETQAEKRNRISRERVLAKARKLAAQRLQRQAEREVAKETADDRHSGEPLQTS